MLNLKRIENIDNNIKQSFIDLGYNKLLINLLINRGYEAEIIELLLNTGYSNELPKYDDLKNVKIGADIIESHIANGSTIYIYGDYDSDGVNSTYILGDAINYAIYYSESSANLMLKVPERHEGYGLSMNWCKDIVAKKNKDEDVLVITVDNGIAQEVEVAYLVENNIDVLITDHHMPNGHTPKNVWIIDAFYNNDDINNKGLCGAGVAFKLAMTLLDRFDCVPDKDSLYYKYLVHVAIATITDSMPMTIDNIKYVYNGIQLLKDGYGSEAITYYRDYNSNTVLTPKDIAFGLGPQINACGRMNNTALALDYLFAESEEVEDLYNEVVLINEERKTKTKKAFDLAETMIDINLPSIIIELDDIEGIGGIVASNLSSKYNKCTIIFCKDSTGKYLIGSARNDGNIDLLSMLKNINIRRNDIILKVGGHSAACGITIYADKLYDLIYELNSDISSLPVVETDEDTDINIIVDDYITVSDITKENCDALKHLYFFTETNPVFAINDVKILKTKASNNNNNNIMFTISDKTKSGFEFWSWGIGEQYRQLGEPTEVTLIGEIEYKFGKPSFNILNIIPRGMVQIDYK